MISRKSHDFPHKCHELLWPFRLHQHFMHASCSAQEQRAKRCWCLSPARNLADPPRVAWIMGAERVLAVLFFLPCDFASRSMSRYAGTRWISTPEQGYISIDRTSPTRDRQSPDQRLLFQRGTPTLQFSSLFTASHLLDIVQGPRLQRTALWCRLGRITGERKAQWKKARSTLNNSRDDELLACGFDSCDVCCDSTLPNTVYLLDVAKNW